MRTPPMESGFVFQLQGESNAYSSCSDCSNVPGKLRHYFAWRYGQGVPPQIPSVLLSKKAAGERVCGCGSKSERIGESEPVAPPRQSAKLSLLISALVIGGRRKAFLRWLILGPIGFGVWRFYSARLRRAH